MRLTQANVWLAALSSGCPLRQYARTGVAAQEADLRRSGELTTSGLASCSSRADVPSDLQSQRLLIMRPAFAASARKLTHSFGL
jgi:hypothetical protein